VAGAQERLCEAARQWKQQPCHELSPPHPAGRKRGCLCANDPEPSTLNPQPQTLNPKPYTLNALQLQLAQLDPAFYECISYETVAHGSNAESQALLGSLDRFLLAGAL
jgi:hypothetical protein